MGIDKITVNDAYEYQDCFMTFLPGFLGGQRRRVIAGMREDKIQVVGGNLVIAFIL